MGLCFFFWFPDLNPVVPKIYYVDRPVLADGDFGGMLHLTGTISRFAKSIRNRSIGRKTCTRWFPKSETNNHPPP